MSEKFFQDYYPDEVAHCYGCGRLNEHGLHIHSYWDGDEAVCLFEPKPYHIGFPGFVYGGLIASLIDCHSMGAAAAAKQRADGIELGDELLPRFVTASLKVEYLRPTPIGSVLEVRARVQEIKGRKVLLAVTLSTQDEVRARGEVIAVEMPEQLRETSASTL
jgi:acyl-coenzyme A thioesterase PaaI-like protein